MSQVLDLDDLAAGVAAGHRPALARSLSLAERDPVAAADLLARLAGSTGRAHVVGITGPPGAGKSTLVGVMLRHLVGLGRRVAVLAVDPSSPVSGGALLGDRFRMGESSADERAFIRSTAARGSLGGLTRAARQMVGLMDAAGYDLVIVETVGTGQSEMDVARLADTTVVAFPPGLGDELQAIKAGILELADFLVVTKSDTPGATQASQALQAVAPLWRNAPAIFPVSALSGDGLAALVDAVLVRSGNSRQGKPHREKTLLVESVQELLRELARRLKGTPADGVSMQLVAAEGGSRAAGQEVLVNIGPGPDVFQLGTVAGMLVVLAEGAGLRCSVTDLDRSAGRLSMLIERSAL